MKQAALIQRVAGGVATRTIPFSSAVTLVLVCAAILVLLHATHDIDSDEGLILHGAWSILHGRVLYKDFFDFVAPASFYLVAAVWSVTGAHFWVAKVLAMLAIGAAAWGVLEIARLTLAERPAQAPSGSLLFGPLVMCLLSGYWPAINHNTFNLTLLVWSTYFACRSLSRNGIADARISGLLAGLSILFLQHRGGLLAGVLLGAFCYAAWGTRHDRNCRMQCMAAFLLGLAVPIASVLLFWPASLLRDNLIRFPAEHYLGVNRLDNSLFLLAATWVAANACLLRRRFSPVTVVLLLIQAVLLLSALQRPDTSHITSVLFPMLALFPLLVHDLARAPAGRSAAKYLFVWTTAGLVLINVPVALRAGKGLTPSFFLVSQNPVTSFVREHCHASPYLYAGPFIPGVYFETRKLNATRFPYLLTRLNTEEQFQVALDDLKRNRPQCAVTQYEIVEKFRYDRRNVVDEYLVRNYRPVFSDGAAQVWMSDDAPSP
jgi:hypothetical protein